MSEKVFFNLEKMLPELENFEERGVFSQAEIQKIIETRRKHESRLQRADKKLLDVVRYIESEAALEKIRDKRLKKYNLQKTFHDQKISKRIINLYKLAIEKFNEKQLLPELTEYAIKKKLTVEMKEVYAICCLRNPLDVDLWVYCASKLFEIDDVDGARALFFKGIRMNPSNMSLRKEFFRMEVLYITTKYKEIDIEDDDDDDVQRGDVPYNIFLDTMDVCFDEETLQEMLNIAKGIDHLTSRIKLDLNR